MGCPRVYTSMKKSTRTDKEQTLEDKVASVLCCSDVRPGRASQVLAFWFSETLPLDRCWVDAEPEQDREDGRLSCSLWGEGAQSGRTAYARAPPPPSPRKLLPLGLLLGCRQLVIRAAKLLDAHHPSPGLRSQGHRSANGLAWPGSPWRKGGNDYNCIKLAD
jgi:hypothetical protein